MENIESASQSVGVDTSVDNATQPHSSDEVCDQEDKRSTEKSEGEEVVPSDAEAAVSAVSTEKIAADSAKNPKLTCEGGPLTNPGIVVTRADRPSAISRARQTKYDQLKERYWQKSKVTKQVMDLMTQYLNEDPPIYKRVKAQKLVLQDMMPDLSNLIDEVRNMAPCPEIEEDFPVLSDCVDNLLSQYRMRYPKASSSAVSSELTSSVVSSVHSRRTVDVALDIVQRKEAVAAEGQAKVEEVENVIEVLQQRIKQEDMQRRKAEEDVDKAERDVDAHVRQQKEEAERRREEAEKEASKKKEEAEREANRKKEDADREASKKKEKARRQLKEEREQREQRKEELEAMIAERRKQKENIVKEYKEKETRVVMETIAGQLEVESKPPDLPNLSMVEAYVNPNVLTPLKQNLVGQALSKNQVGRPASMMTTRLHQGLPTADRQPLYGAAADGGLYTYINEATSTRQHAVGRRRPMTERHPEGWRTSAGHLLASTDHHSGRDRFPLWYSPYTTAVEAVGTTTMTTNTTTMAATVTSAAVTGERNTQGTADNGNLPHPPHVGGYGGGLPNAASFPFPTSNYDLNPEAPPFLSSSDNQGRQQDHYAQPTVRSEGESHEQLTSSTQEVLTQTLVDAVRQNRLPVQEPSVFMGDPLSYPIWKSAFSMLIERQNIPEHEKLLYLQKYVSGPAKDAIKGFFLLRTSTSFQEALTTLEKRYGNSFVVAQAFRDRLDAWPVIKAKDGEGLRKLADFLRQCLVASRVIGQMTIFDDAQYQRRLLERLPEWIMFRWARVVDHMKSEKQRYPTFEELTDFIAREAEIACEPVFSTTKQKGQPASSTPGQQGSKVFMSSDAKSQFTEEEVQSLKEMMKFFSESGNLRIQQRLPRDAATGENSSTSNPYRFCLYCRERTHRLVECKKLAQRPLAERKDIFFRTGLCFGCGLTTRHRSKDCRNRETCQKCGKAHLTILHADSQLQPSGPVNLREAPVDRGGGAPSSQNAANQPEANQTALQNVQPNRIGAVSPKMSHHCAPARTTMIVPVYVSTRQDPDTEVLTYALLDTMSYLTFVSEEVSDQLDVKYTDSTLRLNTVTAQNLLVKSRAVKDLRVRPLQSHDYVDLPTAHTSNNLSVSPEMIPTPEIAMKHQHLRGIAAELHPLQSSCVAGLLIGYDCAEALMPLQVIQGIPFAIQTRLGWSVVGEAPGPDSVEGLTSAPTVLEISTAAPIVEPQERDVDDESTAPPTPVVVAHVFRTSAVEASTTDILHLLERDFVEKEVGFRSQDDVRFLKILEEGIIMNKEGHAEKVPKSEVDKKELPLRKLLTEGPNDKELGASEIDIISTDNVSVMAAAANSVVKSMEDRFRRFSSLKSLLRAVGFILRFWAQRRQKSMTIVESWTLARERIVALAQREFLSSPPPSVVNTLKQLGCRVNDRGLIVVEGRLSRSRDYSTAQPVLLPRESHVTTLIAEECHQKTGHSGRTTTIHAIREHGYWIIGIRRVVSRVIGNCVRCRRLYAPPATQKMADLPEDRVTEYSPFLYCGADCFGPFYVKDDRKTMKRYALMVTCLASRAVHIEVIEDMSTDAFLEALRRVIAIRDQIKQIRCDRGTNFVGASRELEKAWKEMDVDSVKAASFEKISM